MVWQDPFLNENNKLSALNLNQASVWDRIAAFNLDLLLIFPVIRLIESPIENYFSKLNYITNPNQTFKNIILTVVSFLLLYFYSFFLLKKYGSTLGMIAFRLKLSNAEVNANVSSYQIHIRNIFFYFQLIPLLGLPLWFLFLNKKNKTLHDLVSETDILKQSDEAGEIIFLPRFRLGLVFSSHVLVFLFVLAQMFVPLDEKKIDSCADLNSSSQIKKIDDYIALYFLDKINGDCLREVSKKEIWDNNESPEAYLALAISNSDKPNRAQDYLHELCVIDKKSIPCLFSAWVTKGKDENDAEFWVTVSESKNLPAYVSINLISYFAKNKGWEEVQKYLPSLAFNSGYAEFVETMSYKSQMGLQNWPEAYRTLLTSKFLDKSDLEKLIKNAYVNNWQDKSSLKSWIEHHWDTDGFSTRGIASEADEITIEKIYRELESL